MSTRTDILNALRTDFGNVTGIKKVWKYVKDINSMNESDFPSIYTGFGTAINKPFGDLEWNWEVPVMLLVYFSVKTDTDNSGKLETEAERLFEAYRTLLDDVWVSLPTLKGVKGVTTIDLVTASPYVNTGVENKGFLLLEFKLNYIGA